MKLALLLALLVAAPACVRNHYIPVGTPPDVKAVLIADQIAIRVGEFQSFVIDGALSGAIPMQPARVAVTWTVATLKVIREQPNGWQAVAFTAWQAARPELEKAPQLGPWIGVLDAILGGT